MKRKTIKPAEATRGAVTTSTLPLRIKSILVPLDFSPSSKRALDYAVSLARQGRGRDGTPGGLSGFDGLAFHNVVRCISRCRFVPALPMRALGLAGCFLAHLK